MRYLMSSAVFGLIPVPLEAQPGRHQLFDPRKARKIGAFHEEQQGGITKATVKRPRPNGNFPSLACG
jgi:hypothetical protein